MTATYTAADEPVDAVIVGSGFGGSVSAFRFGQAKMRAVLLERGGKWPPGSFPRSPQEITDRLYWDPSRGKFGIFNIWSFRKMEALVSAGLGGGSLIYANVLLRKEPGWFSDADGRPWPVTYDDLVPHYERVEAAIGWEHYPFEDEPYASVPKIRAFRDAVAANGWEFERAPLAVAFGTEPGREFGGVDNVHGAVRRTCVLCGECDVGCNVGAKNTLDWTYLSTPEVRDWVDVRTSCEVRTIAPDRERGRGYIVRYVRHDLDAAPGPRDTSSLPLETVRTDRLVLGAGSIGTTWLLLRNRSAFAGLGPALGTRFCGNGDLLGFVTRSPRFLDPSSGPVITGFVKRDGPAGRGHYVQDAGYPEFLNWAWQVQPGPALVGRVARFAAGLARARITGRGHSDLTGGIGVLLGEQKSGHLMPMLGMGRDVPDGTFSLRNGELDLAWSMKTSLPYFLAVRATMKALATGLGAHFRDNPSWWFRRIIATHPVGGCPMGTDPSAGVVDAFGRVWRYPGMFIADGSVVPGPVGANPSLTIAALADRFADRMVEPVHEAPAP